MGEIAINPIHNVFKKYRTMNFVNHSIFTPPYVAPVENTFIGGVAGTINTAALLASKLAIDVSRITAFSIVGSDVKCRVTGSYGIPLTAFDFNHNALTTYYIDSDNLVNSLGVNAFYSTNAFINTDAEFKNATSIEATSLATVKALRILLNNAITVGNSAFASNSQCKVFYIPSATSLGATTGNNSVFNGISSGSYIYANPVLATNNAGGADGDLAAATTAGAIVRYVSNYIVPNTVTDLTATSVRNSFARLNFTAPTGSTNAIDYYEVYLNGVYSQNISISGDAVIGLSSSTSYSITIYAIDIFYNKSLVSNSISITTNATTSVPTANLVSYYKLEDLTSGSTLNDSYGTDHLTTTTSITKNEKGKIGRCVKWRDANSSAFTTSASTITGNFTINLWCFREAATPSANSGMFEIGNYAPNTGFGIWINASSQLQWRVGNSFANSQAAATIPLSSWTMVTMVYNGATVKFYLNGAEVSSSVRTVNPAAATSRHLFNRSDGASVSFVGKIDEISLHSAALTPSEITTIYNSGTGITL